MAVFSPIPSASVMTASKVKPGRLEQLPKSEAKISHHGVRKFVTVLAFVTKKSDAAISAIGFK